MNKKSYVNELERALARPDADQMCRQLDAYVEYFKDEKDGEWPDQHADDFCEIVTCHHDDPDKALAYVVLAAARTDEAQFLGYMGCGPLEDVLYEPSDDLLGRIVAEAHKSERFRWLLSNPFKIAISEKAWEAIKQFRMTGPHDEPSLESLPPRS